MNRTLIASACVILVACLSTDAPPSETEILEADRAFAQATAANGAEGWVSYFAYDGIMVSSRGVIAGHDSIRAVMTPAFADSTYTLRWEPTHAEIAASGDLGYTLGRYESQRVGAGGAVVSQTGSYLTVWRRGGDGEWKVAVDIGNPDEQPEENADG